MVKKSTIYTAISNKCIYAFTLVEMAAVLTIIALIVGGVMVGKDMLSASKYRNIAVHAEQYKSAVMEFQDKYSALPGDMVTATRVWGRADGNSAVSSNCADPGGDEANLSGTCNGDGDNTIARDMDPTEIYETFRAWQQLYHAGYLKERFRGVSGTAGSYQAIAGQNIPSSDFVKSGYDIIYISDGAAGASYFSGISYHHVLHFGKETGGDSLAHGVAIPAAEAYSLDRKVDDGLPGQGRLLSLTDAACVSNTDPALAEYLLQNTSGEHCALVFITGF